MMAKLIHSLILDPKRIQYF